MEMAKKAARTRLVKSPKVKGSVSSQNIERAIRIVSYKLASSSSKAGTRRQERAAAGEH